MTLALGGAKESRTDPYSGQQAGQTARLKLRNGKFDSLFSLDGQFR